jgi:hypothetical protein
MPYTFYTAILNPLIFSVLFYSVLASKTQAAASAYAGRSKGLRSTLEMPSQHYAFFEPTACVHRKAYEGTDADSKSIRRQRYEDSWETAR